MYTIDDIKNAWSKFLNYAETADQFEFPALAYIQCRIEPLYSDLIKNWNDRHAELFMDFMSKIFKDFGIN